MLCIGYPTDRKQYVTYNVATSTTKIIKRLL